MKKFCFFLILIFSVSVGFAQSDFIKFTIKQNDEDKLYNLDVNDDYSSITTCYAEISSKTFLKSVGKELKIYYNMGSINLFSLRIFYTNEIVGEHTYKGFYLRFKMQDAELMIKMPGLKYTFSYSDGDDIKIIDDCWFTINITAVDFVKNKIYGTFKGSLKIETDILYNKKNNTKKYIKNGSFCVPIVK